MEDLGLMVSFVSTIPDRIILLRDLSSTELEDAIRSRSLSGEDLELRREDLRRAISSGAKRSEILRIGRTVDLLSLKHDRNGRRIEDAAKKRKAVETEEKTILALIEKGKRQVQSKKASEVWIGFLNLRRAEEEYRRLDSLCGRLI